MRGKVQPRNRPTPAADEGEETGNMGQRKDPFLHRPCLNNPDSKHTWKYHLNKKRSARNTQIPRLLQRRDSMDRSAADEGVTLCGSMDSESFRLGPLHGPTAEQG